MAATYFTMLTKAGLAKAANCLALGIPFNVSAMGLGDGNGQPITPNADMTKLVHEVRRAPINDLVTDPDSPGLFIAEQFVPADVGGFTVREMALYDDHGVMIAVGNTPPTPKLDISSGASSEQQFRFCLLLVNGENAVIQIDPSAVIATRKYVDNALNAQYEDLEVKIESLRDQIIVSSKSQLIENINSGIESSVTSDLDGESFNSAESAILLSKLYLVSSASPVTFYVSSVSVEDGNICNVGDNGNITIKGAAPIETTISYVYTVAGEVGNFSVTYNLANAAGMAVGDVLCVDQVLPARVHYSPAFTGARKPVLGEMAIGFNFMGSISVSGITCTVTGGNCPTYLSVGDQVHIQGQTRLIQSVSAASFTIDAPLQFSPSGLQWWWFSKPATGTVGISGIDVTGVGTSFTTQYDVGDIMVVDGRLLRIVTIPSDTAMTITHNQTVPVGTAHSCYKAGLLHEGAFVITAIAGNLVTVTNKSRRHKPPKNLITAGRVRCIKTLLKNTGPGNGFDFSMGSVLSAIADIAVVGTDLGVGLALNGSGDPTGYNQQTGQVQMTGVAAVVGFNKGAFLSAGAVLVATEQFFGGSANHAIECTDGGDAYLRGARVHGSGGIGLMAAGGYARVSSAAFIGHALQGIRQDVGSGVYGDTWYAWGNVGHGVMQVNACGIQFVDSIGCCNGGSGINAQNGAEGRLSRTMFGGNDDHGLNMTGADHEATQIWQSGSPTGRSGIIASRGRLALQDSAQTGNGSGGLYALQMAHVTADKTVQTGNGGNGVRADDVGTTITALSGYHEGNAIAGVTQTAGGKVAHDLNPMGTQVAGSRYREIIAIADDAVAAIYIGNQTIGLEFVSSSTNSLFGAVRARVGTSASAALGWGTGFTVQTGPLSGTTGVDGEFTISPALDGYLYIENRTGSSKSIVFDIMGRIA
ncbi:MAG: phage tail protein [Aeromonas sp.]